MSLNIKIRQCAQQFLRVVFGLFSKWSWVQTVYANETLSFNVMQIKVILIWKVNISFRVEKENSEI